MRSTVSLFSNLAFAGLTALALAGAPSRLSAQEARRPNIILILTDDMGPGDIACYGDGIGVPTPNIDRLAREGARFTQYYAPAPICSPSRAGFLTGQQPGRLHLNSYLQPRAGNMQVDQNDFLDPKAPTLPRVLKAAGYATAHIGKWHLGGGRDVDNAPSLAEYGYDEWVSTWESPDPHPDLGIKYPIWDRREEPGQVPRHRRTEYMVDRTLDFLKRHKDTPCFVNLWPDDTHTPHRPGPEMREKHGASVDERKTPLKNFRGVLEEYDRQIGRLLDGLRELGLEKETIVVFTADNGPEPHFEHRRTGGLRGMKLSLYEGGIREPFLIRWPGRIPAGHVDTTSIVSGLDLPLSLCALAGVTPPDEFVSAQDGEEMSQALLGRPAARTKPLFWEYGRKQEGYGRPRNPYDRSPNVAVREGEWKLLVNDDGTSVELYNVVADAAETSNVASRHADIAEGLKKRALAWRKQLPGRTHPPATGVWEPPPAWAWETTSPVSGRRPNIIVILTDDHGYHDLGVQGAKDLRTPHIDSLARNGIRFTQGYVNAPLCGPSRAALLTGRYQNRFGYEVNSGPRPAPNFGLPESEKTLADYLKGAGYRTGLIGKWHLGERDGCRPTQRGFDEFFGFLHGARSYWQKPDERPIEWIRRGDEQVTETRYLTYAFNEEAVSFIERHKDQPFFLYLAYNAVHTPMERAPGQEHKFPHITDPLRLTMATMLAAVDDGVGQVLDALRRHGLEEETLIVFLSDNGGVPRGNASFNSPFNGGKQQMLEGGIRVPFIMQWKGKLSAGTTCDLPVLAMDILPTALAAAGVGTGPGAPIEGVDLLPYLRGQVAGNPHDRLFWRLKDQYAVRSGDWKLVHMPRFGTRLFNLATDPGEQTDLAPRYPEKVAELQAAWDRWNAGNMEPRWRDSRDPESRASGPPARRRQGGRRQQN